MFRRVKTLQSNIFERRTRAPTPEQHAFTVLVGKFSQIQYLVDQKANLDVIEKAPVGICITNKKYIYEYVNPAYCEICGYTYDELTGKPFTVVVPPEHQKELTRLHDKFMDQEAELEGEWVIVTKSGELRPILANAAYVIDEQRRLPLRKNSSCAGRWWKSYGRRSCLPLSVPSERVIQLISPM